MDTLQQLDTARLDRMELQLAEQKKVNDFDIREFPIEVIVDKFITNIEDVDRLGGEIYIPDYQREMKWKIKHQSRFIESILINLPVPYIFVADNPTDATMEIIDGSQRIRTLARFCTGQFALEELTILTEFNGLTIDDLPTVMKRRFLKSTIRLIEMSEKMDEGGRKQMFDRLNSGMELNPMEIRRGAFQGPVLDFITELARNPLFASVCPLSQVRIDNRDDHELILRFFAYRNNYLKFDHSVKDFIDDYLKILNEDFQPDILRSQFEDMLNFIAKIPLGFRKVPNQKSVPRVRFEAISVGASLALEINPDLAVGDYSWLTSTEFGDHTRSDASNSRVKVINRIHYARDHFLGREVQYIGDVEASLAGSRARARRFSAKNSKGQQLLF